MDIKLSTERLSDLRGHHLSIGQIYIIIGTFKADKISVSHSMLNLKE